MPSIKLIINSVFNKRVKDSFWSSNKSSFKYYSRGTGALREGIKIIVDKKNIKNCKIFFPSYICAEPLIPILNDKINVSFYPMKRDLSPDWKKLEEFVKNFFVPDIFVLVHYFGFQNNISRTTEFCRKYNIELIQDAAHVFLPFESSFNNISVYSPRKFLPIPNGGILSVPKDLNNTNTNINNYKSDLVFIIKWYTRILIKKILIKLDIPWRKINFGPPPPSFNRYIDLKKQHPQSFSFKLLKSLENEFYTIIDKRRKNYIDLSIRLSKVKGIDILFSTLPNNVCPFMLPIMVYDNRDLILRELKYQGIPAISWPELPKKVLIHRKRFKNAFMFKDNIILLPIHQDLTEQNIDYIYNTIKNRLGINSCSNENLDKS